MSIVVYIKEIEPNTFLHFSTRGDAFQLRDFSHSATEEPLDRSPPGHTAKTIEQLARSPGNTYLPGQPKITVDDKIFWHQHILVLNKKIKKPGWDRGIVIAALGIAGTVIGLITALVYLLIKLV